MLSFHAKDTWAFVHERAFRYTFKAKLFAVLFYFGYLCRGLTCLFKSYSIRIIDFEFKVGGVTVTLEVYLFVWKADKREQ